MVAEWQKAHFESLLVEPVRNGIYKPKEFHGRGVKIVNMGELFAYPRLHSVQMKRVELSSSERDRFGVSKGDLLFARRSLVAEGAGKCSVVLDIDEHTAFESSIIRARPDTSKADSLYLYYFFNSISGLHALDTIRRQVAVAGITGSDLARLEVPVPELSEQRAIAHILGALDDKIEFNRWMNETLETMARAIFKSWFVDFDPVRAKAEGRDPSLPKHIADLFPNSFEDSDMGEMPMGWVQGMLADLASDERNAIVDGPFGTQMKIAEYRSDGIPVIEMPYLEGIPFYKPFENFISPDKFETVNRSAVAPGDIVISKTGTLGLLGVMTDIYPVAVLVSRLAKITPHPQNSDLYYILGVLKQHQASHYWDRMSSGSTMPLVNLTHIKSAPVLIPPVRVQKAYGTIAQMFYARIHAAYSESRTLTALRDTLLPKLISGELRVKEAEKFVKQAI
jgi:type I restriction enzyme S subunit